MSRYALIRSTLLAIGFVTVSCGMVDNSAIQQNVQISQKKSVANDDILSLSSGKCSDQIIALLRQPLNEFILTDCPRQAWGNPEASVDCIKQNIAALNRSSEAECVGCWGQVTQCARSNCKVACMFRDPCSSGCAACVREKCGVAHSQCVGLPLDKLPRCRSSRP